MPLSTEEVAYQAIFDVVVDSIMTPPVSEESDEAYFPAWIPVLLLWEGIPP